MNFRDHELTHSKVGSQVTTKHMGHHLEDEGLDDLLNGFSITHYEYLGVSKNRGFSPKMDVL